MLGNYEAVQAKAIAAKGHEVSVLAIRWRTLVHLFECGKLKHRCVDGVHVYECTRVYPFVPGFSFGAMRKFERFFRKKVFHRVLKNYLQKEQLPDVVHAHIVSYAAPAAILKEQYGLPFVITEHWSKANEGNITKRVEGNAFIYRLADEVVCVSEALAKSLLENFGVESRVIYNMVENRFFENFSIEQKTHRGFRFISVGSLLPIKGFDVLIRAFAKIEGKDVTLDVVGGGPEKEKLQSLIDSLNLQGKVRLLGLKKPEEVSNILADSDCFVLASRSETFGIVFIEAMAKGLPVIATKCGGPETIVNDCNGVLVPIDNQDSLAKAMNMMIANSQNYDKMTIRQYCIENYSQDRIADKIIDIYEKAIEGNKQNFKS